MINFEKVQRERRKVLLNSRATYSSNITNYDSELNRIVSGLVGQNKFVAVYNFFKEEITKKFHIKECLGYSDDEFTIYAINNDINSSLKLIHEDDIFHKLRYDTITYGLMCQNYLVESLYDYYKLTFRIKHKLKGYLKVERASYIFELNEDNKPISQLDIWEISDNPLSIVTPSYYTPNYSNAMKDFYRMNSEFLGVKFTEREKAILDLKNNQYSNKEIQANLNLGSLRTVEKHIENIIKKSKTLLKENEKSINTIQEALFLTKRNGLFPFY